MKEKAKFSTPRLSDITEKSSSAITKALMKTNDPKPAKSDSLKDDDDVEEFFLKIQATRDNRRSPQC